MPKPLPDLALMLWIAVLTGAALCAFVAVCYGVAYAL
jgi:hypothetical protein